MKGARAGGTGGTEVRAGIACNGAAGGAECELCKRRKGRVAPDAISKRYGMHRKTAPAPVMYWCSGPMILILHPICIHACVKTGFSNMLCTGRKVPKCRVGIENK